MLMVNIWFTMHVVYLYALQPWYDISSLQEVQHLLLRPQCPLPSLLSCWMDYLHHRFLMILQLQVRGCCFQKLCTNRLLQFVKIPSCNEEHNIFSLVYNP